MAQNDKQQLLLIDLSGRLSYGVILKTPQGDGYLNEVSLSIFSHKLGINIKATERTYFKLEECKPYLRPMSSMTIEEICKIRNIIGEGFSYENGTLTLNTEEVIRIPIYKMSNLLQFMYQRHLDFNNLIPMGLAIEVTKENNPYKN